VGNSIRSSNVKGFKRCVCYLSINVSIHTHIFAGQTPPFAYFIIGRTLRQDDTHPLLYQTPSGWAQQKIEITQSGAAYEKYGAKGLNDVCIAAISLILGGTDSSFACRCLSYPKRKLRIYHCPARSLFAFYEWPKGFENMYFRAHTKKKM